MIHDGSTPPASRLATTASRSSWAWGCPVSSAGASSSRSPGAEAQRWPRARIGRRVTELAVMAGLDESLLRLYPRELSGGQRQRVGLMRALMLDPPMLLLDEPLAALDPVVRAELQGHLGRLFAELGKTVVLVTHDIREAAVLAATITLLTAGRVVQRGTFADLVDRPATPFVTQFLTAQTLAAGAPASR